MSIEVYQNTSYELAPHPEEERTLRVMASQVLHERLKNPANNTFDRFMNEYVHNPLIDNEPEVILRGSDGVERSYGRKLFTVAADGMVFHGRMTLDDTVAEKDHAVVVMADVFSKRPPCVLWADTITEDANGFEMAFHVSPENSNTALLGVPLHYKLRFMGNHGELVRGVREHHRTPLADIEALQRLIAYRQEQLWQAGIRAAKEVVEPSLIDV